jgi:hypothetical protein
MSLAARFGLSKAMAQTLPAGRRFVFLYVPGGWDQLLFLDPRAYEVNASASDYAAEVARTGIDTSYKYGIGSLDGRYIEGSYFKPLVYTPMGASPDFAFGPGVVTYGSPTSPAGGTPNLVDLASRGVPMSIIRGINMGTLGHEVGYAYFLTGEPAVGIIGRGTSMPIRIAAGLAQRPDGLTDSVVPVTAVGIDSYTGDKNGKLGAFSLRTISDASPMLRRPGNLVESASVEAALEGYLSGRRKRARPALEQQLQQAHERTAQLMSSGLADQLDVMEGTGADAQAVRAQYGLSQGGDPNAPMAVAAFVAQAVKKGFTQFISAAFTRNNVDTHGSPNPGHLSLLYPCIWAISSLINDLATTPATGLPGTWLDHTTVFVFSEFARAPKFNGAGRDHHFVNSCLLVGAGVRPGAVVGATSTVGGMVPLNFDFDAQQVLSETTTASNPMQRYIQPEDVGATLLASAGLPYSEYRIGRPLWGAITQAPF